MKPFMSTIIGILILTLVLNFVLTIRLMPPAEPPLSSKPSHPPDPTKRVLQAHGNAAALFVQMGAYRGGAATFAVVGLASKSLHIYSDPAFDCEWVPNPTGDDTTISPIRTRATTILPDAGQGRVYAVAVVNCTFPSNPNSRNSGGKLYIDAFYSLSSAKHERFLTLTESPGEHDESRYRPPYRYDYLYCGSSLYGTLNPTRIREWMAYHAHLFGPRSHFVFHDAGGVSPAVRAALRPWMDAGRLTIEDARAESEYDGYYHNQFLVLNDCLHRYRHAANWTFFFDVDEFIYIPDGKSVGDVVGEFSNYTQITIPQSLMSSNMCVLEEGRDRDDYGREFGFEKLVFRDAVEADGAAAGKRRDRKYAIQARDVYAAGVHSSENLAGETVRCDRDKIRYYHYHGSIDVLGEPCNEFVSVPTEGNVTWREEVPYVYDDCMRRRVDVIRESVEGMMGTNAYI